MNTGRTLVAKFIDDRCTTLASALSFSSMLSIVPFLAIVFAILKALDVHTTLALLPVFMMWIYTCRVIVLAGMEIVWYLHNKTPAVLPPGRGPDGDVSHQIHSQQGFPRD